VCITMTSAVRSLHRHESDGGRRTAWRLNLLGILAFRSQLYWLQAPTAKPFA